MATRSPPAGVGAAEGGTADTGVQRGTGHLHGVDVGAALPVVELAHVVVAGHAVDSGDPLPPEEDVARRLHQPLTDDDPLPVVGVHARATEPLQDGRLCLLDLEEERVTVVAAEEQQDVAAGSDAADADDLPGRVYVAVLLQRVMVVA